MYTICWCNKVRSEKSNVNLTVKQKINSIFTNFCLIGNIKSIDFSKIIFKNSKNHIKEKNKNMFSNARITLYLVKKYRLSHSISRSFKILIYDTALLDLWHVAVQTKSGDLRTGSKWTEYWFGRGRRCGDGIEEVLPPRIRGGEFLSPCLISEWPHCVSFCSRPLGATTVWFATVFLYLHYSRGTEAIFRTTTDRNAFSPILILSMFCFLSLFPILFFICIVVYFFPIVKRFCFFNFLFYC